MSHRQQLEFVERVRAKHPSFFTGRKVVEIGSLDINGSIRQYFHDCDYTGVDVAPGPGVDLVADGAELDSHSQQYDVVASCEMFEHNPKWAQTWRNMINLCRPGGLIFFSCATIGRPEHGTSRTSPSDSPLTVAKGWTHYRNLVRADFLDLTNFGEVFSEYEFSVDRSHCDLYFWGIKKNV